VRRRCESERSRRGSSQVGHETDTTTPPHPLSLRGPIGPGGIMNMLIRRRFLARALVALAAIATIVGAGVSAASAFTYTSGDVLYVAYVSPSGPNYIVNLGPRTNFVNATTTILLPDVTASDLNGVLGAAGVNIWVGLFGVLNTGTRDGIVSANGA